MAKQTYTVASQEGADRYGTEIGEKVELELEPAAHKAVIAAGWLEESKKKGQS